MRRQGMRQTIVAVLAALLMGVSACSSADESTDTGVEPSIGAGEIAPPSGLPLVDGLPSIEVLAPSEGSAGEAPLFKWEPVVDATRYLVAVLGPNG